MLAKGVPKRSLCGPWWSLWQGMWNMPRVAFAVILVLLLAPQLAFNPIAHPRDALAAPATCLVSEAAPAVLIEGPPPYGIVYTPDTSSCLISPGKGIGHVRLGGSIKRAFSYLGPAKAASPDPDGGGNRWLWFEPPENSGIGAFVSPNGIIERMWAQNDTRYVTQGGLHIGYTEAQVRSILGAPDQTVDTQIKTRELLYDILGLWFIIQLDERFAFFNHVFDIGVMRPAANLFEFYLLGPCRYLRNVPCT